MNTLIKNYLPWTRIAALGYSVDVSNHIGPDRIQRYNLWLVRDGARVACVDTARLGRNTLAQMRERIAKGLIRRDTDAFRALVKLAETAEHLAQEGAL